VSASALLLACGFPPAVSSATVHAAECFTTGASAASHHAFGNIDRQLFRRLVLPGMAGAAAGAYVLGSIDGEALKPWIAAYLLLMGLLILYRVWRRTRTPKPVRHLSTLGFGGALLDAIGGGGWGPIVSGTLLARGQEFRFTVGTVNAVEFFVTATATTVFLLTLGPTSTASKPRACTSSARWRPSSATRCCCTRSARTARCCCTCCARPSPGAPPIPLLHIDTGWKFREMIAFRDRAPPRLGVELRVHTNPDGLARRHQPDHPRRDACTPT
jgi:hypothetical protein